MRPWMIITGGGSGIGRGLVQHFSHGYNILTCGRRLEALEESKMHAANPEHVQIVQADIGVEEDRQRFIASLEANAEVSWLIQNAAIGDPSRFEDIDIQHLEHALRVNVVAPVALVQGFLPALTRGNGRIIHLGTSVATSPQEGTLVYGVTKMAFKRLYEQINAEQLDGGDGGGGGVVCGSISPGLVDTEGVIDHVKKARGVGLPHVKYFDDAYKNKWTTPITHLMEFFEHIMQMDEKTFTLKEWKYSEWSKAQKEKIQNNESEFNDVTK